MSRLLIGLLLVLAWTAGGRLALAAEAPTGGSYTATEQANLATAQACFNAFAGGDMDGFFATLDANVVWEVNGSQEFVPHHGKWVGIDAVRDWVNQATQDVEFIEFAADRYFADGDTVIGLCHERDRIPSTGKELSENEAAFLTFANGKIVRMLIFDDSALEHWAMQPDEAM